mmetsp:Transcript_3878/g.8734  ORF Transcript_3878/g.8734 Transcript_3878/m.8734 type:complete len:350 (+) Transcript_3878:4085-5134(+)
MLKSNRNIKRGMRFNTKTVLIIVTLFAFVAYQSCNNASINPDRKSPPILNNGIPNVGNSCYMNATLQILASFYPNIFDQQKGDLEQHGRTLIKQITDQNVNSKVDRKNAEEFCKALIDSYNKGHKEPLTAGQQEDAAPVISFLLQQGKIPELEFYPTKKHPKKWYPTIISGLGTERPATGISVYFELLAKKTVISMHDLFIQYLHGDLTEDMEWEVGGKKLRDQAIRGMNLSKKNIRSLTNRILPIFAKRFAATDDKNGMNTGFKNNIELSQPFQFTIPSNYILEKESCTCNLVGFIRHIGNTIHSGHYTAYVKTNAGWVLYDDSTVTQLATPPLKEAEEAYLYFYQVD